jgi:hypothetical protein
VTKLKFDTAPSGNAIAAMQDLAGVLAAKPGMRIVGVCELAHVERVEPAPGEDKETVVKLRVTQLEVARGEQENHVRQCMAALHRHRTATGKLGEDMEVELSERTIELTAGVLDQVEAARLRAGIEGHADYIRRVLAGDLTPTQLREELRTVQQGLGSLLRWTDVGR